MSSLLIVFSFPRAGRQSTTGGVNLDPQIATLRTMKNSPMFQLFSLIKSNNLSWRLVKSENKFLVFESMSTTNSVFKIWSLYPRSRDFS